MDDLTAFQRDTLFVIAGNRDSSGVEIQDELEGFYEQPVTGGRLYPCLDALAESGLIDKGKKDERTNEYSLTKRGNRELEARREWEDGLVDV